MHYNIIVNQPARLESSKYCPCRFDILQEVAAAADQDAGRDAALQMVHHLLSETLYILHELLVMGGSSMVLPLTQVRQPH